MVRNSSCCSAIGQSTRTLPFKPHSLFKHCCGTGAKQVARLRKTNVQKATVKAALVFKTLLRNLVYTYKPRKSLTLAFDGIASLSKGKEQSRRRMKDWMSMSPLCSRFFVPACIHQLGLPYSRFGVDKLALPTTWFASHAHTVVNCRWHMVRKTTGPSTYNKPFRVSD